MEPDILVFDEPTANLDPAGRRKFIQLTKNFKHTKIIAGHDVEMIKELCNKVVIINNGRKIAENTPQKIFSDSALLMENHLM